MSFGGFQVGPFQRAYQQVSQAVQPSGGWPIFATLYEREQSRRHSARRRQQELEEETKQIRGELDRQIALELRKQERDAEKSAELARLKAIAAELDATEARLTYGDRVAKALERATLQGNYSALEALDRELARAQEEQEWLLMATMLILNENE